MPTDTHGPYQISRGPVDTGVDVQTGDEIRTLSEGRIDFGSGWFLPFGAPVLDANGDTWQTPPDYPALGLARNSLVVRIGPMDYQGGTNRTIQVTGPPGRIVLLPNDATPTDNSQGWSVTLEHTYPLRGVPTPSPTLEITNIEVTQSVQQRPNQIQLVSGKRTMVRVYVDSGIVDGTNLGQGPNGVEVEGSLEVTRTDTNVAFGMLAPLNGPNGAPGGSIVARPRGELNRDQYTHSLNFELPPGALRGSVMARAHVWVPGHRSDLSGGFVARRTTAFPFLPRRVQALTPILVDDDWQGLPSPTLAQVVSVIARARARLPVGEAGFRINPPLRWTSPAPLNHDSGWYALMSQLVTAVFLTSAPSDGVRAGAVNVAVGTNIGGMALPRIGFTIPSLVSKMGTGSAGEAATFAHELGHVFGLQHANAGCGETIPWDPRLPGRTDEPGMEVPRRTVVPRGSGELMSYCAPLASRWPSTHSYDRLMRERPI